MVLAVRKGAESTIVPLTMLAPAAIRLTLVSVAAFHSAVYYLGAVHWKTTLNPEPAQYLNLKQ